MLKINFSILFLLGVALANFQVSAQETSRKRIKLAEKRNERKQELFKKSKRHMPEKGGKLPLSIRESIAKDRGITVKELDRGVVNKPQVSEEVEQGLNFVTVLFVILLITFLVTLFKRTRGLVVVNDNKSLKPRRGK
ncbi:MAG: hypothetical protein KAG98_04970 [Lentisphaeria bacterium]|nr:hypothetical protein [Lentisphaeria bacterium]